MAQTKAYNDLIALIDSEMFNPGRRFLTAADYDAQIRKAVALWAQAVKGLWLRVTFLSVAGQNIYAFDQAHQRIRAAWYIRNPDTAQEERTKLDVITDEDRAYIDLISEPQVPVPNLSMALAGQNADKPKYIIHQREAARIILADTPSVSGDTIQCLTISGPTAPYTAGTDWEADAMDLPGIAAKVCQGLRMKSRDTAEAEVFRQSFLECVELARGFRAKTRQRKQMGDGQSIVTRVNPIFGAK